MLVWRGFRVGLGRLSWFDFAYCWFEGLFRVVRAS